MIAALWLALIAAPTIVKGKIVFAGEPPAQRKTAAAPCGEDVLDEALVVDPKTKGVKDVAIWIENTRAPVPKADPVIGNARCRFEPHLVLVVANAVVRIKNGDRFPHTTLAKDEKGKQIFNVGLPAKDLEVKKTFPRPGAYALSCEVHAWMKGSVVATNGELATVSDASGSFELKDVPGGKRTIHLWHEMLGERTIEVDVKEGQPVEVNVSWGTGP
jgi:plastocyanin